MEPFEHDDLSPQELDQMLKEWQAPAAPPRLRAALFPDGQRPWWKRMWSVSIRIPLPVACCLGLLCGAVAWRVTRTASPVPKPPALVQTGPAVPSHGLTFEELRPVSELRPRIIRRKQDAKD